MKPKDGRKNKLKDLFTHLDGQYGRKAAPPLNFTECFSGSTMNNVSNKD